MRQRRNHRRAKTMDLPPIPNKVYFSIGEVSDLCGLAPHILRYWEQEFHALSPIKRSGNRRYYQAKDVVLIRKIRNLLYIEGYTIEGARQRLSKQKNQDLASPSWDVMQDIVNSLEHLAYELSGSGEPF